MKGKRWYLRLLEWARRRLKGGRSARPGPPKRVMHLMGEWTKARCGVDWSPANTLTVERHMVDCDRCLWLMRRDTIGKLAKR